MRQGHARSLHHRQQKARLHQAHTQRLAQHGQGWRQLAHVQGGDHAAGQGQPCRPLRAEIARCVFQPKRGEVLSANWPALGKTLFMSEAGTPNQLAMGTANCSIEVLGSNRPCPTWSPEVTDTSGAVP